MPQRFHWWRHKDIYFVGYIQRTTSGNLWKKGPFGQETEYSYNSATHKHAVTHLDEVQKYYTVFANGKPGNMIRAYDPARGGGQHLQPGLRPGEPPGGGERGSNKNQLSHPQEPPLPGLQYAEM